MKLIATSLLCLSIAFIAASCGDDADEEERQPSLDNQPTIVFDDKQTEKTINASAQTFALPFVGNMPLNELVTSCSEDWCHAKAENVAQGKGYVLNITIDENISDQPRQAVVTVRTIDNKRAVNFLFSQAAAEMELSQTQIGLDRYGAQRTIIVKTDNTWMPETDADWCNIEKNGNYLTIKVGETSTDRDAVITFKQRKDKITVRQTKYAVGDTYDEDGVSGTVGYIGDDKRFIFHNFDDKYPWATGAAASNHKILGATDGDDGEANTEVIHRQSAWRTSFPAFGAVETLNVNGVTGWYLPAINELDCMVSFIKRDTWSSTEHSSWIDAIYSIICENNIPMAKTSAKSLVVGLYVVAIRKF